MEKRFLGKKLWKNFLIILIISIPYSLFSQEDLINQDVQVIREYNPTISDAFKISDMPSAGDTLKANPVFRYQLKGKALLTPPEIVPLTPARLAKEPLDNLYPAYIQGYVGNYELFGGQLLYNLVRNDKFAVALNVSHDSSLGSIKLEDDNNEFVKDAKADFHETNAGVYLRHFLKKSTLAVNMDFYNYAYRYYGFETINPDMQYTSLFSNTIVNGDEIITEPKQRQTVFDMNFRLNNSVLKNDLQYDVLLGFYTFGNRTGVTENSFRYNGNFDISLSDFILRFETNVDYAGVRTDYIKNYNQYVFQYEDRDRTIVQINPALLRQHNNFLIKIGMKFGFGFDSMEEKTKTYISPDVAVNFTVENAVVLQAGITGNINPHSYRNIMSENPFVAPDLNVKTSSNDITFFAGVSGNFTNNTSFGARVEYGTFTSDHFYVNKIYNYSGRINNRDTTYYNYANQFGVQYDDGRLLKVSGEFKAKLNNNLAFALYVAYYSTKLDSIDNVWHLPAVELGFRTNIKVMRDLNLVASFNVMGERYAMMPPEYADNQIVIYEQKRLKPVFDFNVDANYTLNSRWNLFASVHNIIASKFYLYNGYPMHGINMRAGVGFCF